MADDSGYSVKEVVDITRQEQTAGFAKLEVLLASKADKADLVPIHQRLDAHDGHIRTLQDSVLADATREGSKSNFRNNVKWAIGVLSGLVAAGLVVLLTHIFH